MIGWIGDFFRFWWALFYWNTRKTWFRLHGAHRDSCPCQNFSDSGHALDSRCNAIIDWNDPARFRRVCPLLAETKDGWRCSVDAERVRPFWGRAALSAAVAALTLYLGASVAVYLVLRSASYETTYLTVVWPPNWPELRGSQERLYTAKAQQALAKGNYQEAVLSLQMVCEINPRNYTAGITLASLAQLSGQPYVAEHIYARLLRDVPENRPATAQIWIRMLLARADYAQIKPLAGAMLAEDAARREAWLHALLYAARRTGDQEALGQVLKEHIGLPDWCKDLIQTERLLLQGRTDRALPLLNRVHGNVPSPYVPYYQADRLLQLNQPDLANACITAYGSRLPLDEAAFLRLRVFQAMKWSSLMEPEYENLLRYPMTPRLAAQFCSWLIAQPSPDILGRYIDRFLQQGPAISNETLPLYYASYLAAALSHDQPRAERVAALITKFTSSDAKAMRALADILASNSPGQQVVQIMPLVPLPLEVIYSILDRRPPANRP